MATPTYFIIDFDSTFIKTEGLDEFAAVVLEKRRNKKEILKKIQELTKQGMEGKISFEKSLSERMKLLSGTKRHIRQTVKILQTKISTSVKRNKAFFKKYHDHIYIVSGGFKEFIAPIVQFFGINPNHILANTFIIDSKGHIIGYDTKNQLAQKNGKVKAVQSLHLQGDIYVIGDGYTDLQIKQIGGAKHFIAFTENVKRSVVIEKADKEVGSFDEFLYVNKLPMSFSYPKNRIKVLLLERIHNEAVKRFEKEGYPVEWYESSLQVEKLLEKISSISILGIRSRTSIDETILSQAKRLLTIGIYGIGTNQVNLSACSEKGITIFNTLHIGGSTEEAQKNIGEFVTEKIIDYINNGDTYLSANIPQIQLPNMKQAHRLLHLHHNVPGILAQINGILAKNNINILGQYLKTNEQIGYVITDVNKKYDINVLQELKQIPNTIRFRVLY